MIAMLAVETGIPMSVLLAEPSEYLEAMVDAAQERAKAAGAEAPGLDPSNLAARMAGR